MALSVSLSPVLIQWWVRNPPLRPNKYMLWTTMKGRGRVTWTHQVFITDTNISTRNSKCPTRNLNFSTQSSNFSTWYLNILTRYSKFSTWYSNISTRSFQLEARNLQLDTRMTLNLLLNSSKVITTPSRCPCLSWAVGVKADQQGTTALASW